MVTPTDAGAAADANADRGDTRVDAGSDAIAPRCAEAGSYGWLALGSAEGGVPPTGFVVQVCD